MKKFRNEKGFTLIELIVIIVILGILSVIAVPKYLDLRADAELGTAEGITAALRGAIAISFAKDLINGESSITYHAADIASNVETSEGLSVNATAGGTITATFPSENIYTWTYADGNNGTVPATVTGPTGPTT